jgi:RNA recognition motif-containing protein
MSKKLFVGSLSWNTTSDELRDAFSACGDVVEAKVITDRDTGRSRGFGFVTYRDADGATSAIETLDGSTLDGRSIRVDRANDRGGDRGRDNRKSVARW